MSVINDILRSNAAYADTFDEGDLPIPPGKQLVIISCMDSRMLISRILGIKNGDAHIIRNAGGIVNQETLRSLLISTWQFGTREIMIINHTNCGLLNFKEEDFFRKLEEETGQQVYPFPFYGFEDLEQNVRAQVKKIETYPLLPKGLNVRGFVYDVKTGRLKEIE